MRLISFDSGRAGAVGGNGVYDLTARGDWLSVRALIEADAISKAEALAVGEPDKRLEEINLELPLIDPPRIFCVGVNYLNRNEEYRDSSDAPAYPSLFMRSPLSFSPPGGALLIPRESDQLDYEGEIVLVIGKTGRRIAQSDAMRHVAGLTIMNEGSVRDWIRHGKFNVTQGKNFECSGSYGPWIESDLTRFNTDNLKIETRVNGEVRQRDTTASMVFPFSRIIEYVSTFTSLIPGDLIATGTPTGAGARFDPPKWLKPGDVVEVAVEGVGVLRNTVESEAD